MATLSHAARLALALLSLHAAGALAEGAAKPALQPGMIVAPIPGAVTALCESDKALTDLMTYRARGEKYAYRLMFTNEYCEEPAETATFLVKAVNGWQVELADTQSKTPSASAWGVAESFREGGPNPPPGPQTRLRVGMLVEPVVALHGEFLAGCVTRPLLEQAMQFRADRDKDNFELYFQRRYCVPMAKDAVYQVVSISGKAIEFISLKDAGGNVITMGGFKLDATPVKKPDAKTKGWWAPAEALEPVTTLLGDDQEEVPLVAASAPQPAPAAAPVAAPAAAAAPAPLKAGMVVTPVRGKYWVACDSKERIRAGLERWVNGGRRYQAGTYDADHCRRVFENFNYRVLSLAGELAEISGTGSDAGTRLWVAQDAFAQARLSEAELAAVPGGR